MARPRHVLCLCVLVGSLAPAGCEVIAAVRGFVAAAGEVGEHLEGDLKAELTDAKISKVIEVAPALKAFAATAKHKWEPDPSAPDFSNLVAAFGSLGEYIAFFEEHGTRLTEFYVDLIKIADARAVLTLRKAHAEASAKLEVERVALEGKLAAATADEKPALEEQLAINKTALEDLKRAHQQEVDARAARSNAGEHAYALTDAELARVEARLSDIDAAFTAAGYKSPEPTAK